MQGLANADRRGGDAGDVLAGGGLQPLRILFSGLHARVDKLSTMAHRDGATQRSCQRGDNTLGGCHCGPVTHSPVYRPGRWLIHKNPLITRTASTEYATRSTGTMNNANSTTVPSIIICTLPARMP